MVVSKKTKKIQRGGWPKLGFHMPKFGRSSKINKTKISGPTTNSIKDAQTHLYKQQIKDLRKSLTNLATKTNKTQTNHLHRKRLKEQILALQTKIANTSEAEMIHTFNRNVNTSDLEKAQAFKGTPRFTPVASGVHDTLSESFTKSRSEVEEHAERFLSEYNGISAKYKLTGLRDEAGVGFDFIKKLQKSQTATKYLNQYKTAREKAVFIRNLIRASELGNGKLSRNNISIAHRKTLMNIRDKTKNNSPIPTLEDLGVSTERIAKLKQNATERRERHYHNEQRFQQAIDMIQAPPPAPPPRRAATTASKPSELESQLVGNNANA